MNIAVVYKSVLGTTRKYAAWIAQETGGDAYPFREADETVLRKYDTVILASGTYMNSMPLAGYVRRYWKVLSKKKVILVSVGVSAEDDPYTEAAMGCIPPDIRPHVKLVRLPGSFLGYTPPGTGSVKKENIKSVLKLL